jgi:hypothetical protein
MLRAFGKKRQRQGQGLSSHPSLVVQTVLLPVPSSSNNKILLPSTLAVMDPSSSSSSSVFSVDSFVDSGCSAFALLSNKFAALHNLSLVPMPTPFNVSLADGSSGSRISMQTLPLRLDIGSHSEEIQFLVADIPCPIMLGLPWLIKHNPRINWRDLIVHFADTSTLPVDRISASSFTLLPYHIPIDSVYQNNSVPTVSPVPVSLDQSLHTPPADSLPDVQLLNAASFFAQASKERLTVFAARLDIIPAIGDTLPTVSISAVLNDKDYQQSGIQIDDRGVPLRYSQFSDVFAPKSESPRPLPPHRSYDLAIDLVKNADGSLAALPSASKVYPISPAEEKILSDYIQTSLARGWIRHSSSPIASPCFFVKKPNGGFRLCIDYRAINNITVKNKYPLPLVSDLVSKLQKARIFTHLDLPDAYHLVRIKAGDEWKTAFRCKFGHFEYNVVSFGLSNAPAAFQFFMNDIFSDLLGVFVIIYLDDILIFSEDEAQHEEHVKIVLQRLCDHSLQVNPAKCAFHTKSTDFLGLFFKNGTVSMDPAKVNAVLDWPAPTTVQEMQMFLGFANFYRQFIRDYSEITKPLTVLTRKEFKNAPLPWSSDAQEAFSRLKSSFASAPSLSIFDPEKTCFVESDTSDFAIGAILSQFGDDGLLHPVAFHARQLIPAEVNYDTHDKELLGIVDCFSVWRHFLVSASTSNPVIVLSDHLRLEKFTTATQLSRRQYRWTEKLSEFSFKIIHRPGRLSAKPDAISRRPDFHIKKGDDLDKFNYLQLFQRVDVSAVTILSSDATWLKSIVDATAVSPLLLDFQDKKLSSDFKFSDGILYFKDLIVLPTEELLVSVFKIRHCSPAAGHFGIAKTVELISRDYWAPHLRKSVRRFILNCDACQRSRPSRHSPYGLLQALPVPESPWSQISMDFIVDLPLSNGFDAMFVVKDRLSKMAHFIPTYKTATAEDTADLFIREIFRLHGAPQAIVSDRDSKFTSTFWQRFMSLLNIKINLSSAFHPESDGSTEVINQVIEQYLRVYCNYQQDNWAHISVLPLCEFAYNNSLVSTTSFSPFFSNYGFNPLFDPTVVRSSLVPAAESRFDQFKLILADLRANLSYAQSSYTVQANKSRLPLSLQVGDLVFLDRRHIKTARPSTKLDDRKLGPFKISCVINPVAYKLNLPSSMRIHPVFHVSLLEPKTKDIVPSLVQPAPPPPVILEGVEEFEVESILDSRIFRNGLQYLVHWKGFSVAERSWEPASHLKNSLHAVQEFHSLNPSKPSSSSLRVASRRKRRG